MVSTAATPKAAMSTPRAAGHCHEWVPVFAALVNLYLVATFCYLNRSCSLLIQGFCIHCSSCLEHFSTPLFHLFIASGFNSKTHPGGSASSAKPADLPICLPKQGWPALLHPRKTPVPLYDTNHSAGTVKSKL